MMKHLSPLLLVAAACAQPCDNPAFTPPCPSPEFTAFFGLLQLMASEAAGVPKSVHFLRLQMAGFGHLGLTARVPTGQREEFYGGVRTLVFGDNTMAQASGKVIVYLHAGGYVAGSVDISTQAPYDLSLATGALVVSVDYSLAPEFALPKQVDEVVAVYKDLLALGVPCDSISFVGGSAGGGLVLLALQKIRDQKLPTPSAGVCLSPWVELSSVGKADTIADPAVNVETLDTAVQAAVGNTDINGQVIGNNDATSPVFSPLHGDFTGLPPLYFIVSDIEVLLEDTIKAVEAARAARVKTKLWVAPNMLHVFPALGGVYPEAGNAIASIAKFLKKNWAKAEEDGDDASSSSVGSDDVNQMGAASE